MKPTPAAWLSVLLVIAVFLTACSGNGGQAPAPTQPAGTNGEPPTGPEDSGAAGGEAGEAVELPPVDPFEFEGRISIAGSSTVYPLSEAVAERFEDEGFLGEITIASVGSGAGFERFCIAGETDIANASRPIEEDEISACRSIGREPLEFRVGTDALAIVVSQENDFLTSMTIEELAMAYSDQAQTWAEVNPEWPDEPIQRFSPGSDSGTYDFFIETVMAAVFPEDKAEAALQQASGIQFSEDDNVLVQGVLGSPYAIGYFGYAYYLENADRLKVLAVEGIEPTASTAESGEYPLSRPLYMYSDATVMRERPQVAAFINFFLTYVNEEIEGVGYFPANEETLNEARQKWLEAVDQ
jgi:phosphate binding protein